MTFRLMSRFALAPLAAALMAAALMAAAPAAASEPFTDWRPFGVLFAQRAAFEQWNPHCLEIPGVD